MKQLIACCGLDCESCDARIATVENDNELKEKTARKWSVMNNAPEITAATINCMGCRADGEICILQRVLRNPKVRTKERIQHLW